MIATQILGVVDGLIAQDHEAFVYPETSEVTGLISNGQTERNYVIQSSAPTARMARRSWTLVPTDDMHTLRAYATTKDEVTLVEEDETERLVIVRDIAATQRFVGYWDVTATLVETGDPSGTGS